MKKDIRKKFKGLEELPGYEDFEDFPGMLLWQLQHLWQRQLNSKLDQFGLTHMQYIMLSALEVALSSDFETTQANLAKAVKFDIMMTSNVLRTLEKKELITRTRNPKDIRAILLDITPKGKRLVKKARVAADSFNEEFFSPIGQDLKNFTTDMIKLINNNIEAKKK